MLRVSRTRCLFIPRRSSGVQRGAYLSAPHARAKTDFCDLLLYPMISYMVRGYRSLLGGYVRWHSICRLSYKHIFVVVTSGERRSRTVLRCWTAQTGR